MENCKPCLEKKGRAIAYLDFSKLSSEQVLEDYDYIMDGLTNVFGLSEIQGEQLVSIALTHTTKKVFLAEGSQDKLMEMIKPLLDLPKVPITVINS